MKKYPQKATKSKDCPPHYFKVDSENVERCVKCPLVVDFGERGREADRHSSMRNKAMRGGVNRQRRGK